jgi:hypothetical protein
MCRRRVGAGGQSFQGLLQQRHRQTRQHLGGLNGIVNAIRTQTKGKHPQTFDVDHPIFSNPQTGVELLLLIEIEVQTGIRNLANQVRAAPLAQIDTARLARLPLGNIVALVEHQIGRAGVGFGVLDQAAAKGFDRLIGMGKRPDEENCGEQITEPRVGWSFFSHIYP